MPGRSKQDVLPRAHLDVALDVAPALLGRLDAAILQPARLPRHITRLPSTAPLGGLASRIGNYR